MAAAALVIPRTYNIASVKRPATFIFVHGLGDTGEGLSPIADAMSPAFPHVKWVLPTAPRMPVTANMSERMTSWFDIYSFDFRYDQSEEDRSGMLKSARTIDQLIQKEIDAGVPPERIVLGGFSQGGAMTLLAGLSARGEEGVAGGKEGWKLGGLAVLSGWLPLHSQFREMLSPKATSMPIYWGHGTSDPIVRYKAAQDSVAQLTSNLGLALLENTTLSGDILSSTSSTSTPPAGQGNNIGETGLCFRSYKWVGHSLCAREQQDLQEFLKRVLPE
ncbi:Phospholipase/Carboxylesterase-domain-containing protein [Phlebopus sp. FC_14]|nr:Phospholipase/Carboxylesterase-domain-containing protein [Phlebopus sp. FC_14]